MDFKVRAIFDINHKVLLQRGEQVFLHQGQLLSAGSAYFHGLLEGEYRPHHLGQGFAVGVFEGISPAQAHSAAIYFIDRLTLFILDPKVSADGDDFLAD